MSADLPILADGGAVSFPIEKPAKEINCKQSYAVVAREFSYECDCVHHIAEMYCHRCHQVTRFIMERYLDRTVECVFCSRKTR